MFGANDHELWEAQRSEMLRVVAEARLARQAKRRGKARKDPSVRLFSRTQIPSVRRDEGRAG